MEKVFHRVIFNENISAFSPFFSILPVINNKNFINTFIRLKRTKPSRIIVPVNRYTVTKFIAARVADENVIPPINVTTTVAKIPNTAI